MSNRPKYCAGTMRHAITIERRANIGANPGSAEPEHSYETVLTTRGKIETRSERPWHNVNTNEQASHTIMMRATRIPFDTRDRVKDAKGNIYVINSIEDVNEYGELVKLICNRRGAETTEANQ